jgi:hypothetical protein
MKTLNNGKKTLISMGAPEDLSVEAAARKMEHRSKQLRKRRDKWLVTRIKNQE